MNKEWLTTREAAAMLSEAQHHHVSVRTLRWLIKKGRIEAKRVSYRVILVNAESVKNYEYQK